jgi:hypothetical protein
VRDDLRQVDRKDRPFLRYFILTHLLHNNPEVPNGDLRIYRAALAKAVNRTRTRAFRLPRSECIFGLDSLQVNCPDSRTPERRKHGIWIVPTTE